jgi:indolepyruvate ferredoxin oxidoreductase, alpha subunit
MSEDKLTRHLRGDAALAWGALAAGVGLVSGYPGAPATAVLEALAADRAVGPRARWAPNEKVALEMAYGASLGGVRALAVMKGVGLNIALDPLATMALSGCAAGLVILVGDDPGGWGSQNEQDSRHLARLAEVPLVTPTGVARAAALMGQAFAWSEAVGTPLIVHFTGALAAAEGEVDPPWALPERPAGFVAGNAGSERWVVLPANVVANHRRLHGRLQRLRASFEGSPYDVSRWHQAPRQETASPRDQVSAQFPADGVLAVGAMAQKLREVLAGPAGEPWLPLRVLELSSLWPLPDGRLLRRLGSLRRVLLLEEGGPFVEDALRALVQRRGLHLEILGRADEAVPAEGELGPEEVAAGLRALRPGLPLHLPPVVPRAMPSRVPLCPDCPYLPTFEALLCVLGERGGRDRHVIVGETGCMVRAQLEPLRLFDVKYSLGAGLGLGLGLALSDPQRRTVAILGDSSFFHTDLNALPHAAQLNPPLTVLILDNGTTALTGGQEHPGSPAMAGLRAVDLLELVRACGVEPRLCHPAEADDLRVALREALDAPGLSVLVIRGPCPRYVRGAR